MLYGEKRRGRGGGRIKGGILLFHVLVVILGGRAAGV